MKTIINPVHEYKGKAKCRCGRRAKWRMFRDIGGSALACNDHKSELVKR